jgi:predicted acyltransferase
MKNIFALPGEFNQMHITGKNSVFQGRVLSVDSLRGFDMFWIIGGEFIIRALYDAAPNSITSFLSTQVEHVEWFGFRFYDIIMPLFLFIVGVSMPFSYRRRLSVNPKVSSLWPHIIKRFILLWILGMMVQGNLLSFDWEQFKFYSNTLQAIAAGYLIASIVIMYLGVTKQIIAFFCLLLVYWAVLALAPVPGVGAGVITPEGNFAIYLDKLLLGRFQDGTPYSWILSSLNFGATTLLGIFAGYLLQSNVAPIKKFWSLAMAGIGCILFALLWDLIHPIVKHIWTGSFVFYAGGWSLLLLAAFYLVVDYWKIQTRRKFFIIIGANAIFAYMASHLFDWGLMADSLVGGLQKYIGNWYGIIRAAGGFGILWFVLWQMYRHKIFIKI